MGSARARVRAGWEGVRAHPGPRSHAGRCEALSSARAAAGARAVGV